MRSVKRREFIESAAAVALGGALVAKAKENASAERPAEVKLKEGWLLQSSTLVPEGGEAISRSGFQPAGWCKTQVPCTVLSALVKNGFYPDPRVGLNTYRIPDSSDEFNRKFDLAKFSHLPDKRNPWRDPYWCRTEFTVPESRRGQRLWLVFKGINYRADVWLNGRQLANRETMVGMYQRFFLDGGPAQPGVNCLAVKIYPVDHPDTPDPQLTVFGRNRDFRKDLMKDVTYTMSVGYDCMLTQPDRDMGLWQGVSVRFTGPVDIRNPFVKTDLPLPETRPATLSISAELINATQQPQSGILRGSIPEAGLRFEKAVRLQPGETQEVAFPEQIVNEPRLWWPVNLGEQPLYELNLEFVVDGATSAVATTTFGIRKVTKELYIHEKWPGLRIYINGQKCFSRGGWIQADLLLDWDEKKMDAEVRYFAQANLNTVSNEDIAALPDEFLDACDRHGVLYWNCFYASFWVTEDVVGTDHMYNPLTMPYAKLAERQRHYPLDHDLLERCTIDVLKRYRNHPSLIMWSCTGEGQPAEDVFRRWRKQVLALDNTRLFVESPDPRCRLPWLDQDWPSGLDDAAAHHDPISELKDYYENVRGGQEWMFSTEVPFMASMPPVESLQRFIPDLWQGRPGPTFPLNATWAHHGANFYFRPYDTFIRQDYGEPDSVEDYCMKGHLVTADHHRAVSEAVNHRMWAVTSGSFEWKINSSFPDVQWQIHDWYLRPMVSLYYYRLAFEPLHLQYSYLDRMITVLNQTLQAHNNLEAHAQVYSFEGKVLWEKRAPVNAAPNTYGDLFPIPPIGDLMSLYRYLPQITPVYFLRLMLRDSSGEIISRNFYWLSAGPKASFRELPKLPSVQLTATHATERKDREVITRVKLENATDQIAFFIHVGLLNGETGAEVLPVRWDDNYFSLVPGESREVSARHASEDLKGVTPVLDVGGWNILSPFESGALRPSRSEVKPGEPFEVTAEISKTALDGSLVQLLVDGKPLATKRVWARGHQSRPVTFQLWLDTAGPHTLQIGGQTATLSVKA